MRAIWLVMRHAVRTSLRKRFFWITTLIMPTLMLGFLAYSQIQESQEERSGSGKADEAAPADLRNIPRIGLLDEAGLITRLPRGFPPDLFVRFADLPTGQAALEEGAIEQLVLIPADYIAKGEIVVYDREFQIAMGEGEMSLGFGLNNARVLDALINLNLTGDEQLTIALQNPTPGTLTTQYVVGASAPTDTTDEELAQLAARLIPYLFYFVLLMGSGYLLQSVTAEKEDRTAELLLLSVEPRQLMVGKMMGATVVTLIQLVAWLGSGLSMIARSPESLSASALMLTPTFIVSVVLYLVLGYMLYVSIMAAAGALAPTSREGGRVTALLVLPLMPTLMFASEFARHPNGTLPVVLSLFPFSAPSAMVTRLAVTVVPTWQLAVSLLGLGATAYLFVLLAARFFRADNLLSSVSFTWRRFLTGWREG